MRISDWSSDVCSSDLLLHPDKISQFKASLKSTIGNAHMKEIGAVLLTLLVLPARNLQQILLRHDVDVFGAEPGNGQCDAIAVVAQPLYIEGGIVIGLLQACAVFEQVKQPVEAHRRTAIRGKIKLSHLQILFRAK